MTAADVLAVARRELGTVEKPANSNRTRYGATYGMDGQPWCAMFVWWVFRQARALPLIPKTAYTPTFAQWFKDRRQWGSVPRPGAVVFFDFPGDGVNRISHVGIVEAVNRDGSIVTIEGNTSAGTGGSQRDGGGVYRRTRRTGIVGYGYPAYTGAPPSPSTAARPTLREGATGEPTGSLQAWLNRMFPSYSRIDLQPKRYGPQTVDVVREWQRRSGLVDDGVFGPASWAEAARQGFR